MNLKVHVFYLFLVTTQSQICFADEGGFDLKSCLGHVGTAVKIGQAIYTGVQEIYNTLQPKTTKESESDQKIKAGMEQRLTDQIKHVSKKLDSLRVDMENMKEEIIDKIMNQLPEKILLRINLQTIETLIDKIENLFRTFELYMRSPHTLNNDTILDFADSVTTHGLDQLPNALENLHKMLSNKDTSGSSILSEMSQNSQIASQMCHRRQSLQQVLNNFLNAIILADIKGYSMIISAYQIKAFYRGGSYQTEMGTAETLFLSRISGTIKNTKIAMRDASREVWACDIGGYKEGVTFTRLDNVFQKYLINENDMSSDGSCTSACPDYKKSKIYDCYDGKICAHQIACNGTLYDCEYKISSMIWICPSDLSNRRYEYIEYGNSQRYGPKGSCPGSSIEQYSWTRGFVACSYCMCTCDDVNREESDRYINMRPAISNFQDNYVITGLRFVKKHHILHIKIQQGQLQPGGIIDDKTVDWKPIEEYKVSDRTKYKGQDYHVLEWKLGSSDSDQLTTAAVNLDDLDFTNHELGKNHVLTGLRFTASQVEGSGDHVNLEILMTPFNFTSGKIDWENSVWYSKFRDMQGRYNTINKDEKTRIDLQNLDIPINHGANTVPTSKSNQYLYFTTSSLERDAGQNTIPFIDLQEVVTYPHVPLSGAAVIHKSSPGTGGFLALKLFTFDYEPYLSPNVE